ncbi:hypothetical protein EK904_006536 [Melospiza melodia maxima]|nr:hypothetical protein EK904_006536 [Melospiza melodia maxima]
MTNDASFQHLMGWERATASSACETMMSSATLGSFTILMLRFDIYRKVPKDLTQPTYTGAISK